MTQPTPSNHGPLIRSNVGNNGDTTFVDYDNLHPTNETAAALNGAVSGGVLGAGAAFMAFAFTHDMHGNGGLPGKAPMKLNLLATTAIVAVPAVIGAITSVLKARTHNDWSNRVLASVEHQKQANQL